MSKIFSDASVFKTFFDTSFDPDVEIISTSGAFDPLHIGHLQCIQSTAGIAKIRHGICVIIVNGDNFLIQKKGKQFMSHSERMQIVAALDGVDYVVGWDDDTMTVKECLKIIRPSIFVKGGEHNEPSNVPEYSVCQEIGCEVMIDVGKSENMLPAGRSPHDVLQTIANMPDLDEYDMTFRSHESNIQMHNNRMTDKPWGHEELLVKTDKYAAKILTIFPNKRLSRQYHEKKDETIYVLQGTLCLEIGPEEDDCMVFMQMGECRRIEAGTIHRFGSWNGRVKLFEVSTPELDDVIRIQDDFGRI